MPKFLLYISLILLPFVMHAQNYPFTQKWQNVEQLLKQGQLKSLKPLLEDIYNHAQKENNAPNLVKALITKSNVAILTSDNDEIVLETQNNFLQEIEMAQGVEKSVLQSLLAELYYNYLNENAYKILNRSTLNTSESYDFRTWDTHRFLEEIDALLQQSLQPENLLIQTQVKDLDILLGGEEKWRFLRPSVYDLLSYRALNMYKGDWFNEETFDSSQKEYQIKSIYTKLIASHQKDINESALIEAELQKIKYDFQDQYQSSAYRLALENLLEKYRGKEWSGNILYEIALTYTNQDETENDYVSAVSFCNEAIALFPKSHGAAKCIYLKENIEEPNLSLTSDGSLWANRYNPLYITHKNLDKIYYKVYKQSVSDLAQNPRGFKFDHIKEKFITHSEPIKSGAITLKKFSDYKTHSTKIPFEPLPSGNYIILWSSNPSFSGQKSHHLFQATIVSSEINLSSRFFSEQEPLHQLVDKATGLPIKHTNIDIYQSLKDNPYQKIKSLKTNEWGRFHFSNESNYNTSYLIKVANENAYIPMEGNRYLYDKNIDPHTKESIFFTDRSIYRPGQTVYFKNILYKSTPQEKQVAPNQQVKISLIDRHGKEISTLALVSNEFGSIHGEFILPSSGLTGSFRLQENWSNHSHYIKVEEYKRPKFEVKLDSLRGIYQLNDKVMISGHALMFSGAKVSDAEVVYRVYRQAYHPYRYWWRPYPTEPEVQITHGKTVTDNMGNFSFDFTALPSKEKKANDNRAYRYKIVADVIDISGETHTAESSVNIGDIPFSINIDLPENISSSGFKDLKIKTTNLNGVESAMQGQVIITEIWPTDRVLRNKQEEVDYELISKTESVEKLPYIAYQNDHLLKNKPRGHTVLNKNWDTAKSNIVAWQEEIKPGMYEVKATSVYKNDTIEYAKVLLVTGEKNEHKPNTYFSVQLNQKKYEPGDQAEAVIISDAQEAHALVELEVDGAIVDKKIIDLHKKTPYRFIIKENYRGNVFLHTYFDKFNETTSSVQTIEVPYNNKKLDISTSTFRNKLLPGEEETWELTIKDSRGDQLFAEVLAGMYDKSLDQFTENDWQFTPYQDRLSKIYPWKTNDYTYFRNYVYSYQKHTFPHIDFEDLNLFGLRLSENLRFKNLHRAMSLSKENEAPPPPAEIAEEASEQVDHIAVPSSGEIAEPKTPQKEEDLKPIHMRKNLEETAFFFPHLKTDKNGHVKISFKSPESLTTWNLQALAHTPDLKTGVYRANVITQKELMVVPNAPRFLREGDHLIFKVKIINLSNKDLKGKIKLELLDALTMQPIDAKFNHRKTKQTFKVKTGGNTTTEWALNIPKADEVQSVVYRVLATADNFTDGEENALPILTNRTLVTETLPMSVRENQTKTFTLHKLQDNVSDTKENYLLTMEMTTNPIWYAVMALPYLREYPYECSEQVFARFYGNIISQHVINTNPKIKAVFDEWNTKGELKSPLEKNQELKNILLEETPWVRSAESETEQMKRIALLFNLNKMRQELKDAYLKLEQKQSNTGGFPWFEGGRDNYYITTHIVSGFGHLNHMNISLSDDLNLENHNMLSSAINFIDQTIEKQWNQYQSNKKKYPLNIQQGLNWLYARSYHLERNPLSVKMQTVRDYFLTELEKNKFQYSLQTQAMLSLVLNRYGKIDSAKELIASIKDRAVDSEEMGMYWKENISGYAWLEAPIETQAMLIEAFDEIAPQDIQSIESMKVWLLKNKQTNQWNSTKATTEAVYALMKTGKDWTNAEQGITIKLGSDLWYSKDIKPSHDITNRSGYIKESWDKSQIKPTMGSVEINKTSPGVAWGAMYWQYFEDLDKVTSANSHVTLRKQLYIQRHTDQGPKLFKITSSSPIKMGDLVTVRLEIKVDRAMEFVHIKDMRASGFEPVNVLSQYQWQDGLGYYESTRDAATHFFIDYLPKGIYVFEYDVRANNAGIFSNGITQLQNMYAPEFSAHTQGIHIKIE